MREYFNRNVPVDDTDCLNKLLDMLSREDYDIVDMFSIKNGEYIKIVADKFTEKPETK